MSDFIIGGILGVCLGIWLFYLAMKLAVRIAVKRASQELQDLEKAIEQYHDEVMIPCRVESHQGMFFVYNDQTNEFMAQGNTLAELRERIKARWANIRVSVVSGDEDTLAQLKAQLNESSNSQ
jgi:hypothetical protein